MQLSYDPEFTLLGMDKKKTKTKSHKNLYMNIHKSSFIRTSNWKPPRCPSTGEWLNCATSVSQTNSLAIKKSTDTGNNLAKSQENYAEWGKSQSLMLT